MVRAEIPEYAPAWSGGDAPATSTFHHENVLHELSKKEADHDRHELPVALDFTASIYPGQMPSTSLQTDRMPSPVVASENIKDNHSVLEKKPVSTVDNGSYDANTALVLNAGMLPALTILKKHLERAQPTDNAQVANGRSPEDLARELQTALAAKDPNKMTEVLNDIELAAQEKFKELGQRGVK